MSTAQKKKLMEQNAVETKNEVDKRFRALLAEAEAIPLRTKAQYPLYVEARMLHLMRGVAEIEGMPVQELMRESIQAAIDKRMRPLQKKKRQTTKQRT